MRPHPVLVAVLLGAAGCAGRCPCPAPVGAATVAPTEGPAPAAADGLVERDVEALRELLRNEPDGDDAAARVLAALAPWVESGRLRPALRHLVAASSAGLAPAAAARRRAKADQAHDMLEAQLCVRGLLAACAGVEYRPEGLVVAQTRAAVEASALPRARRTLHDPAFVAELERMQQAPFVAAPTVRALVDGPASFPERARLFASARRTIHVLTWAFYDDGTGHEAVAQLVAAARRGVAVRVVVDGQTASGPPYGAAVAALEAAARGAPPLPIEVVRWRNPARRHEGQHRKVVVVDGEVAILGGMNFGDAYSHRDPADPRRWRDTDLLLSGAAAAHADALFAMIWEQRTGRRVAPLRQELALPAATDGARAAIVDHEPGDEDRILLSLCKAVDGATRSVDVENAYVVRTPALAEALEAAVRRGVRVRLLTNSDETLDEPILAYAVLRTARDLAARGVSVWLQRGRTLHSKLALVDDVFAQVGSYNLHPRSHRLEGEVVANVLDPATVATLRAAFERDLEAARPVARPEDVVLPDDLLGRAAWWLFPDLL